MQLVKNYISFRFGEEFNGICLQVFENGLMHSDQRHKELKLLKRALKDAKETANTEARE